MLYSLLNIQIFFFISLTTWAKLRNFIWISITFLVSIKLKKCLQIEFLSLCAWWFDFHIEVRINIAKYFEWRYLEHVFFAGRDTFINQQDNPVFARTSNHIGNLELRIISLKFKKLFFFSYFFRKLKIFHRLKTGLNNPICFSKYCKILPIKFISKFF